MTSRHRDRRTNRDLQVLDEHGFVACDHRDRGAAHRAATEGIATGNRTAVSCKTCPQARGRIEPIE